MKIAALFVLLFLFNMTYAFLVDLIEGTSVSKSLRLIRNSYAALSPAEFVIICGLLCALLYSAFAPLFRKKKRATPAGKS